MAALADAGLTVSDVDGLASHGVNDSTSPHLVAAALGVRQLNYYVDQFGGGSTSHSVLGNAAMAVATGVADTVVCYRAINSRSGIRQGRTGTKAGPTGGVEEQYKAPYGFVAAVPAFAMLARAHMTKYGTTPEDLGAISINQRHNASLNERAMLRTPITLDDYLGSRTIADPLRLLDCCLETDGACAIVVTSVDRARHLPHRPVVIGGAVWGGGTTLLSTGRADLTETAVSQYLAKRLYSMSGIGPTEVDVAQLYDCFTITVLLQLEEYGFCKPGEGGDLVRSGATGLDGALPVNTHGGFLSEGYIHGLNHVAEAVSQLRGTAGARQVPGAEVALSTGQPGIIAGYSSAVMLHV
jgi:acetyl-CoA acetyltransferase